MKILFIGTVEFSKTVLEHLIKLDQNIVAVLTKEKSDFNADYADLSEICIESGIEYQWVKQVNNPDVLSYIKNKEPDIIFCFGWSQLLKEELLSIPKLGVLGFHPALLPQNRGRHPIIWALALGLKETGSTFFFMDQGADSGDILSQEKIAIDYNDDAQSLYDKITDTALKQIEEFCPLLANGAYKAIKQSEDNANSWRKRGPSDGEIDWRMSSSSIYNLVRALTKPYVGAHFIINNDEVKIWKVEEVINSLYDNLEPGKIIEINSDNTFLVKAGDHCIKVLEHGLKNRIDVEYL